MGHSLRNNGIHVSDSYFIGGIPVAAVVVMVLFGDEGKW